MSFFIQPCRKHRTILLSNKKTFRFACQINQHKHVYVNLTSKNTLSSSIHICRRSKVEFICAPITYDPRLSRFYCNVMDILNIRITSNLNKTIRKRGDTCRLYGHVVNRAYFCVVVECTRLEFLKGGYFESYYFTWVFGSRAWNMVILLSCDQFHYKNVKEWVE